MSKQKKEDRKRYISVGNVNPEKVVFHDHKYVKMTIERLYRIYCCVKEFARENFYGLMVTIMLSVVLTVQQGQINYLNDTMIHQMTQLRFCNTRFEIFLEATEENHIMHENKLNLMKARLQNSDIEVNKKFKNMGEILERLDEKLRLFESKSNKAYIKHENLNHRIQNQILENNNEILLLKNSSNAAYIKQQNTNRRIQNQILGNENNLLLLQTSSNVAYTKEQNVNRRIQNKILENENGIRFTKHEFHKMDLIDTERVKMMKRLAEEMEKINEETTQLHREIRIKTDSFFAKVNSMKKDENEFAKEKDSYHNHRYYNVGSIIPDFDKMAKVVIIKVVSYVATVAVNTLSSIWSVVSAIGSWFSGFLW